MPFASIDDRRAYQREYCRPYVRARWQRWRDAGACGHCGLPVKRFTSCNKCRRRAARRKHLARWRLRRAA